MAMASVTLQVAGLHGYLLDYMQECEARLFKGGISVGTNASGQSIQPKTVGGPPIGATRPYLPSVNTVSVADETAFVNYTLQFCRRMVAVLTAKGVAIPVSYNAANIAVSANGWDHASGTAKACNAEVKKLVDQINANLSTIGCDALRTPIVLP